MLTLGSLFDGIGGWQLAAIHNGVTPIWSSEIEAFPCAVTAKHFPKTVQLGDITKLDGTKLWPVDIVCAGSPCQDLSIGGKQEGLKGARSGLFLRAVDIVRRMRFATGRRYPRFFVWENVPGAFSSNKGMDFRTVLEEITESEIPIPPNNKWADAGMVEWDGGSLAWRILDAQYWGVPQRRRRIFLVADFRGQCAGEILFERESVSRDSSEGRETREGTAAGVESGAGGASGNCLTPWDVQSKRIYGTSGKAACLAGSDGGGGRNPAGLVFAAGFNANASAADSMPILEEQTPPLRTIDRLTVIAAGFKAGAGSGAGNIGYEIEKSPTLLGGEGGAQKPTVAVYDMTHADEVMRRVPDGRAPTLNARMGTGGNQVPVIANNKSIRRLTPTECDRLQGLPDGYTLIDDKSCSDSARYKAVGNGMAQPCADWVIKRIVGVIRNYGNTNKD